MSRFRRVMTLPSSVLRYARVENAETLSHFLCAHFLCAHCVLLPSVVGQTLKPPCILYFCGFLASARIIFLIRVIFPLSLCVVCGWAATQTLTCTHTTRRH